MKWILALVLACSLLVPFGASLADQSTAPGQQKKEAGDGSAKDYAPGQDDDAEAEGKKAKKAAKGDEGEKADKAKSGGEKAVRGATTRTPKAKKK